MEKKEKKWYIDSWAVFDGIAFVSLREPDSINAEATAFLSVPDLEPVPVGRISTALRAQRNCFQDRFCDEYRNEFAFDTLAQVQETIRRAYLAGGLAPSAAPARALPEEPLLAGGAFAVPLEFPTRSGGAFFEENVKRFSMQPSLRNLQIDYSVLKDPVSRKKTLADLHKFTPGLYAYARVFGEATLIEFLSVRHDDLIEPEVREVLRQWIAILYSAGLWDSTDQLSELLKFAGVQVSLFGSQPPEGDPATWLNLNDPASLSRKDSVFRVPCPLRTVWDTHIKSLHHKLLLPLVDRTYFENNTQIAEFVPLLFCSLVIAVAPSLRAAPSMFQESDHYRLMGRALHWINTELPSITLPEGVEHALTKFAWDQLYRNTPEGESGPTPHKLHPHGGPPLDPSGSTAAPIPIFSSPLKLLKPSERQLITNKG